MSTVKYNGRTAKVRPATINDGIVLGRLSRNEPDDIANDVLYHNNYVGLYVFIAPVTTFSGIDGVITFQEFCNLDQVFVRMIMQSVRDVNAHWFENEESDDDEKKG